MAQKYNAAFAINRVHIIYIQHLIIALAQLSFVFQRRSVAILLHEPGLQLVLIHSNLLYRNIVFQSVVVLFPLVPLKLHSHILKSIQQALYLFHIERPYLRSVFVFVPCLQGQIQLDDLCLFLRTAQSTHKDFADLLICLSHFVRHSVHDVLVLLRLQRIQLTLRLR